MGMTMGQKLVESLRLNEIEKEIKYKEMIKDLVENNKDRNENFWDYEEAEKTRLVLERLNSELAGHYKERDKIKLEFETDTFME